MKMNAVRNDEAESAVIGGILLDDTKIALSKAREVLAADDFEPHKGALFAEICCFEDAGKPIDILSLAEVFKNDKRIDRAYILNQVNSVVSSEHIDYYIGLVKNCSLRRRELLLMEERKKKLLQGADPCEIITSGMVQDMGLLGKDTRSRVRSIREVMTESYYDMEKRMGLDYLGVQTNIVDFDRLTGGIFGDCVITIAGRPGTGKTTFTQQILLEVARNHSGLFASLEMSSKRLGVKMLANQTGINSRFIDLPKKLRDGDWPRLSHAVCDLSERNLFIDDSCEMAASQIAARARRLKYQNPNLLFLAVDYLQIMPPELGRRFENRRSEVNEALRILKQLARELNICVIILSQILREQEKGGKPHLGLLKESGAIEEMSDIIIFLYKDQESEEKTKILNRNDCFVTPVLIAKNKYGPPDVTFDLIFNRAASKFEQFMR
jgi:replicative DNA helicase